MNSVNKIKNITQNEQPFILRDVFELSKTDGPKNDEYGKKN